MEEQIEIQTHDEVQQIDNRRIINDTLNTQIQEQTNNMEIINQQLENISLAINDVQPQTVSLEEVTNKIDELDTNMITVQNQDILETLANQQNQINSIEEKINIILQKIDEM